MLIFILMLGLCLGSFVNALVWRVHAKRDWVKERSECIQCHHGLSGWDLIPVFSWLSLKGRCRYCSKSISPQYPVVELTTSVLFVISYFYWPTAIVGVQTVVFISWLALLTTLVALALYDFKYMLLPNSMVKVAGVFVGAITLLRMLDSSVLSVLSGAVLGLVFFGGLFYVLYQISDGRWIGGGDVKLGFVLGFLLGGAVESLLAIFIASFVGSLFAILYGTKRTAYAKKIIPFGPMLILGTFVVYIFSHRIFEAYYNFVGLQ